MKLGQSAHREANAARVTELARRIRRHLIGLRGVRQRPLREREVLNRFARHGVGAVRSALAELHCKGLARPVSMTTGRRRHDAATYWSTPEIDERE